MNNVRSKTNDKKSQFLTSKLRLFCVSAAVFAAQISSHDLIATLAWKLHFSFQTPNLDLNQEQFYYGKRRKSIREHP